MFAGDPFDPYIQLLRLSHGFDTPFVWGECHRESGDFEIIDTNDF